MINLLAALNPKTEGRRTNFVIVLNDACEIDFFFVCYSLTRYAVKDRLQRVRICIFFPFYSFLECGREDFLIYVFFTLNNGHMFAEDELHF